MSNTHQGTTGPGYSWSIWRLHTYEFSAPLFGRSDLVGATCAAVAGSQGCQKVGEGVRCSSSGDVIRSCSRFRDCAPVRKPSAISEPDRPRTSLTSRLGVAAVIISC